MGFEKRKDGFGLHKLIQFYTPCGTCLQLRLIGFHMGEGQTFQSGYFRPWGAMLMLPDKNKQKCCGTLKTNCYISMGAFVAIFTV